MIAVIRRRAAGTAVAYASLVDILLATLGIFVVVFALQDIEGTPITLVPVPVVGFVHCTLSAAGPELRLVAHLDGEEIERVVAAGSSLAEQIRQLWPGGARLFAVVERSCAGTPRMRQIQVAEEELRRIVSSSGPHLIEIVPATPDIWADLQARWRLDR